MATWNQWMNATENSCGKPLYPLTRKATQTYSRISALGLETVIWQEFSSPKYKEDVEQMISAISLFIRANKPCLFIYDPHSENSLKKDFLFNLRNIKRVKEWALQNTQNLGNYSYLVTSQITNPGNGFVGALNSDGRGNILCCGTIYLYYSHYVWKSF